MTEKMLATLLRKKTALTVPQRKRLLMEINRTCNHLANMMERLGDDLDEDANNMLLAVADHRRFTRIEAKRHDRLCTAAETLNNTAEDIINTDLPQIADII
jgi:hypothetical protein